MAVVLKNPEAPATIRQLYRIKQLTGEDMSNRVLNMQEASDIIEQWEVKTTLSPPPVSSDPFTEAHVTLIVADQGGGKSVTAVAMVVDSYYNDCIKNYCKEIGLNCTVKAYDKNKRIARVIFKGQTKHIQIPEQYELHSNMRIFANFHLYGIPFVWIPSFAHLLKWLKMGLIVNGWLLIDEYYIGGNARDSMTAFGKELEKQGYQMRKKMLEVVIITPHAKLIDKQTRLVPTKTILVSCNNYVKNGKKKFDVTMTVREKGKKQRDLDPFDATYYFNNYDTNEGIHR